jgi:hypothetical protein
MPLHRNFSSEACGTPAEKNVSLSCRKDEWSIHMFVGTGGGAKNAKKKGAFLGK